MLSGDDDPLIPTSNARFLARKIPNATLEIVERAGHLFLCDDPRRMSLRIRNFIGPKLRRDPLPDNVIAFA